MDSVRTNDAEKVHGAGTQRWHAWACVLLAMAALVLLALVPGYYSFDELQWLARGRQSPLPWVSWTQWHVAQYRPLTFNLWLGLSHLAGYVPWRLHLVWAMLAGINAWLLGCVARSFGVEPWRARWAAVLFLLSPYAMFVHAWVGTLADVLVLLLALLAMSWLRRPGMTNARHATLVDALVVAALTMLALACKESAVVLPLLLLGAAYRHPRPRRVVIAAACSLLPVALYLALRLQSILYLPQAGGSYTWSVSNIALNLLRYLVYPFAPDGFEVHTLLMRWKPATASAFVLAALLVWLAAWRGRYWLLAFVAVCVFALGPVLILDAAGAQYAYLASAGVCLLFAVAAPVGGRWARRALVLLAIVSSLHGAWLGLRMVAVARVQQQLYADLLPRLQQARAAPWRVGSERPGDIWMPRRLLHGVAAYRGVPVAGRVQVVEPGTAADLLMAHDGRLHVVDAGARVK